MNEEFRETLKERARRFTDDFVDAIVDAIAHSGLPERYDQKNSPLGRRKHLELARTGVLPSEKIGRQVLVKREDIDRYLSGHRRTIDLSLEDQIAEAAGLGRMRRGA